ncbi:hypothetical protein F7R91_37110 [Streptomyces luteolifulvus]|uniref:Uncharacterized protein n=1 Tax=Streptomyces luteolifulvus TaxID=2615112 RepID=A0A643JQT6_9ACTN|nr:hypothetical protein [Streptomyces luteolifulvus]KAB1140158.1 hypothetical protein F7R91_37110 [Streptomyces luteolifulvus]
MAHTFAELVEKQRAARQAHNRVDELRNSYGPPTQHTWTAQETETYETALRAWRDLDRDARSAVAEYAREQSRPRQEIETELNEALRQSGSGN